MTCFFTWNVSNRILKMYKRKRGQASAPLSMIRANLSNEMILSLATKCRTSVRGALIRVHVSVYGFLRPLLIQFLRVWYHASVYVCVHIELWRNGDSKLSNEIASGTSNHPCKDLSCKKMNTIFFPTNSKASKVIKDFREIYTCLRILKYP